MGGYVPVQMGGKASLMDCAFGSLLGDTVNFDAAQGFSEGVAAAQTAGLWGYVGTSGDWYEIEAQFQDAGAFSQDLAPVKQAGKWGYIDRSGSFVIPPQFDQAEAFSDGIAGVEVAGKYGFVLPSGRMTIAPQFDQVRRHNGCLLYTSRCV